MDITVETEIVLVQDALYKFSNLISTVVLACERHIESRREWSGRIVEANVVL